MVEKSNVIVGFSLFLVGTALIAGWLAIDNASLHTLVDSAREMCEENNSICKEDGAYKLYDLSYGDLMTFLRMDKTDEHDYDIDEYNCYDFSRDVCNNAFDNGIHCGFVYMEFIEGGHAIVAFNTTDQGLVYIDPQYDDEISPPEVGKEFYVPAGYEKPTFNDTILRMGIIW